MSKLRDFCIMLVCIVALVIVGVLVYNRMQSERNFGEVTELPSQFVTDSLSIDERVAMWLEEKQNNELYRVCFMIPEVTYRQILEKLGTSANYVEIATEYIHNTEYYISRQIATKFPEVIGPDSKNIESVEIKTNVKRPDDESSIPRSVNVVVTDSIHD